ncbi:MAG: hypothetical protein ACI9C1_003765 [Candidatus Aldehydirespiratoraceae bacterium]|jgi:hypothetical protein
MTIKVTKLKVAMSIVVVALLIPATAIATHSAGHTNFFDDVADNAFYADAATWAKTNEITTGSPSGSKTFKPTDGVTRGESVLFLKRYQENVVQPALDSLTSDVDTLFIEVDALATDIDARLGTGSNEVTQMGFEVRLDFESTMTIAEVGPLSLSLRCYETDTSNPSDGDQNRATLQMRAFSTEPFMTTKQDAVDLYPANTGVTVERALGASTSGQAVQTSFIERLSGAGALTAEDGSQIAFNGEGIQVAFNVNGDDCYARGIVTTLPAR